MLTNETFRKVKSYKEVYPVQIFNKNINFVVRYEYLKEIVILSACMTVIQTIFNEYVPKNSLQLYKKQASLQHKIS